MRQRQRRSSSVRQSVPVPAEASERAAVDEARARQDAAEEQLSEQRYLTAQLARQSSRFLQQDILAALATEEDIEQRRRRRVTAGGSSSAAALGALRTGTPSCSTGARGMPRTDQSAWQSTSTPARAG